MDFVIALLAGVGLAISCGLNPYLPLLVLSVAGIGGKTTLYNSFNFLGTMPVLILLAVLVGLDIFGDKFPQIEKLYINLNYLIRPVAGAVAFAAIANPTQIPAGLSFLLGLILAEVTYLVKLNWRPAVLSGSKVGVVLEPLISIGEDLLAAVLALLTLGLAVLGGIFSILILAGMSWWLLSLRRRDRSGPTIPEAGPTLTKSS